MSRPDLTRALTDPGPDWSLCGSCHGARYTSKSWDANDPCDGCLGNGWVPAPRLSVELVPSTQWGINLRSALSQADWERCKRYVRDRSGDRCEVCGGRGPRWPVECHEKWAYELIGLRQRLVGLIALCPACHEVKHIGRAGVVGRSEEALAHLCQVNGWPIEAGREYVRVEMMRWRERSRWPWWLDLSWLATVGIDVPDTT